MKLSNIGSKINRLRGLSGEADALRDSLNSLEKAFSTERASLQQQIADLRKQNDLLVDRLYQLNDSTNKLLYRDVLSKRTVIKSFHPLVSIIIPVYNGSNYLSEAIDCALGQIYDNIEIIVINDGSTDGGATEKIALSYKGKIHYYKKENGGVSSALNFGIKHMSGEYFAWLSHDDLITCDHIANLVEWASYKEASNEIPFSSFFLANERGEYLYGESRDAQLYYSDFKYSLTTADSSLLLGEINGGSVLIPKKAFDQVGLFNERLRITQERDLWNRLSRYYRFINIPFCTAVIRIHNSQVSSKAETVTKASNKKILEIVDSLSKDRIRNSFQNKRWLLLTLERFYQNNSRHVLEKEMLKRLNEKEES